jgi:hypothetical protein
VAWLANGLQALAGWAGNAAWPTLGARAARAARALGGGAPALEKGRQTGSLIDGEKRGWQCSVERRGERDASELSSTGGGGDSADDLRGREQVRWRRGGAGQKN